MRQFLIRAGLFALLIITAVLFFILIHEPPRQQVWNDVRTDCAARGPWMYHRLHADTTPIDVAFIGTSYTMNTVADSAVQRLLSAGSPHVHVANLGYCRPGENLYPVIVRELLTRKRPRLIVVEVRLSPSQGSHPMYGHLATGADILHPPIYSYQSYFTDLLTATTMRFRLLREGLFSSPSGNDEPLGRFGHYGNPSTADAQLMAHHRTLRMRDTATVLNWNEQLNTRLSFAALREVADICSAHGIALGLLYFRPYGHVQTVPKSADLLPTGVPVWTLPGHISQDPMNYYDHSHLNLRGSALLSVWLDSTIRHQVPTFGP